MTFTDTNNLKTGEGNTDGYNLKGWDQIEAHRCLDNFICSLLNKKSIL